MFDDDVNFITAAVDCPGVSSVPAWSQLIVMGPFALDGFQLLAEILNVSDVPVPVFLTYTVLVWLLPGVIVPQSIVERLVVQPLSEYSPKFGVTFIEPLVDKLLFTDIAP